MGAISADVPSIIIPVGPMLAGHHEGRVLGACTDCRRLWAAFRAGELDQDGLDRAHDQLMPTAGTCMVMGTASTMAALAETLGFTLPGAATAPAVSSERMRLAEATGVRAVAMAKAGGPKPSELLTPSVVPQRVGGAAGDQRLDQRRRASCRDRGPRRHQIRSRRTRPARPRSAGADQPQARRRTFRGTFPCGRQCAGAVAAACKTISTFRRPPSRARRLAAS